MMKNRGLTLLELMIVLAMLAVVSSLALPSFGAAAQRARLKNSAEILAADLAEARFQAAQRGQSLFVDFQAGSDWCWAVATAPGCACGSAQPCQLKTVRASDHPGIKLLEPQATAFDPSGAAVVVGSAVFESARGERLRVNTSLLGRTSVCAAGAPVPGYGAC